MKRQMDIRGAFKLAPRTMALATAALLFMVVSVIWSIARDGWSALWTFLILVAIIVGMNVAYNWTTRRDVEDSEAEK